MRRTPVVAWIAAALVAAGLAGCVSVTSPARTEQAYALKASATADAIRSAVETADKTARAAGRGRLTAPLTSVLLSEAESGAGGAEATFAGLQPPSDASEELRQRLLDLADEVGDVLTDLRIAARRAQLEDLPDLARDLPGLSKKLEKFSETVG
jgi:hypothetical protein